MGVYIRGVDEKVYREFKAESIRRGLKIGEAVTEALKIWLNKHRKEENNIDIARKINNATYRMIKGKLLRDHLGKWIAIADGRLMAVSDSLEQLCKENKEIFEKYDHVLVDQVTPEERRIVRWRGRSLKIYREKH
ncbi:MAG: hypothetical protein J7J30_02415 [Candidatus Odinarchaeota archaeon]|nr:hypothetical protein [Candidatus Odinarchaeota archaeon]